MRRGAYSADPELCAYLPPLDAWKVNPHTLKRFYAPVDDRGFVIPKATIERVLRLFEDDYPWPVDWSKSAPQVLKPDDHHFHWTRGMYARSRWNSSVPDRFRELPTNRGIVPRQFHNVLHYVTLPPRVPYVEDMKHYLRSFEIAKQLFVSAERASCI